MSVTTTRVCSCRGDAASVTVSARGWLGPGKALYQSRLAGGLDLRAIVCRRLETPAYLSLPFSAYFLPATEGLTDSPTKEAVTVEQRNPFEACVSTAAGKACQRSKLGSKGSSSGRAEIAMEISVLVSGFFNTIMCAFVLIQNSP